jgi:hypothetical protein
MLAEVLREPNWSDEGKLRTQVSDHVLGEIRTMIVHKYEFDNAQLMAGRGAYSMHEGPNLVNETR